MQNERDLIHFKEESAGKQYFSSTVSGGLTPLDMAQVKMAL